MSTGSASPRSPDGAERVQYVIDIVDAAARDLLTHRGVDDTLDLVVKGALQAVPGAAQAGVSLVSRSGAVTTCAPTDEVVRDLDEMQARLREGPCVDAIFEERQVTVPDLDADTQRWPRFAETAVQRGFRSMVAFQLFSDPGSAGALNLYAPRPDAFDELALEIGALFASHAAIALFGAQHAENIGQALATRDLIARAKGIVMARYGLGDADAFSLLVRTANDRRIKLVELARGLNEDVAAGTTPRV
ncbi:GAF and ANTAR domain-containing protein [Actinomycetospora cinnamomea]|uniref:GAF domain-containing protein n=1 Tax=Actinomycetospora cinnamomea TaxID=663609 RepID=A0A2U1F8V4_9PSEU|nr:GAF and ANTAR domain-containing protein [Actinomycetospora cinnamomea]PVZ08627.1 GAF domain-containing protein [Actinomycetospora cinnamomea]